MAAAVPLIAVATGGAIAGLTALEIIGVVALSFASQKFSEHQQRSQLRRLRAEGQRYNVRSSSEPLPVVYGHNDHLSGAIVWQVGHSARGTVTGELWGNQYAIDGNTEFLTTVIAWSQGEIWAYGPIYINDIPSTDSRFHVGSTHYVGTSNYVGTTTQTADSWLVNECAQAYNSALNGKWTSDHRLRSVAYSRVTCFYTPGLYGADGIPTITAKVFGINCYDPRSGASYPASRNPALIALDYLRSTSYGLSIPDSEIDMNSFALAASYCDEAISSPPFANRSDRYRCDIVLDPTADPVDNLQDILRTCRGMIVYGGGLYRMVIEKPEVATFDLNETNLTGEWSIQLDSLENRFNEVYVEFINAEKGSKPDFTIIKDANYLLADNNEVRRLTLSLPGVTGSGQAYDLGRFMLRQSRYSIFVEVNAIAEALRCEVGDVVTLTHEVPGWTAKPFRVQEIALKNTDEVRLSLREYSASVYEDSTDNADEQPGTTLANPLVLPQIPFIQITERKQTDANGNEFHEALLKWNYPRAYGAYWFEINWIADSVSFPGGDAYVDPAKQVYQMVFLASATFWINEATSYRGFVLQGLKAQTQYAVRMRARSSIGGESPWSLNWLFTTLP